MLEAGSASDPFQRLSVDVAGEARSALADTGLVGASSVGDDVVVNTEAQDLALGSGGFDIVHVNLTRGCAGEGRAGAHVMKLNYTSLQHAVLPVEGEELAVPLAAPVAVFGLHGQLAPVAWAFGEAAGDEPASVTSRPPGAPCPGASPPWSGSCGTAGCWPGT